MERFLVNHNHSLLAQTSKFLNVDRIVYTKTKSTVRLYGDIYPLRDNRMRSRRYAMRYYMGDT